MCPHHNLTAICWDSLPRWTFHQCAGCQMNRAAASERISPLEPGVFPLVCRHVPRACDQLWFQNEDQADTGGSVQLARQFHAPPSQIVRTSFWLVSGSDSLNILVCRVHPLVPEQELLQFPQGKRQWLALSSHPVWIRLKQVHSLAIAKLCQMPSAVDFPTGNAHHHE